MAIFDLTETIIKVIKEGIADGPTAESSALEYHTAENLNQILKKVGNDFLKNKSLLTPDEGNLLVYCLLDSGSYGDEFDFERAREALSVISPDAEEALVNDDYRIKYIIGN